MENKYLEKIAGPLTNMGRAIKAELDKGALNGRLNSSQNKLRNKLMHKLPKESFGGKREMLREVQGMYRMGG